MLAGLPCAPCPRIEAAKAQTRSFGPFVTSSTRKYRPPEQRQHAYQNDRLWLEHRCFSLGIQRMEALTCLNAKVLKLEIFEISN